MNHNKYTSKIFGFEDYSVYQLPYNLIDGSTAMEDLEEWGSKGNETFILLEEVLKSKISIDNYGRAVFDSLVNNHKELLSDAKTVYIHPNCSISRSLVSTKYKKSLSPWVADVVVMPNSFNKYSFWAGDVAIFVNEESRFVFIINTYSSSREYLSNYSIGDKLWQITRINLNDPVYSNTFSTSSEHITPDDIYSSELIFIGKIVEVPKNYSYFLDIISNFFPNDKVVFEQSLQESLADDSNKITLDNLLSIQEMLNSSDSNTVAAALKALSMLDYIHYYSSVKKMLADAGNSYLYNKAMSSTSVKFMFNQLYNTTNRRKIYYRNNEYGNTIREEDYKLFRQYIGHKLCIPDQQITSQIMDYSFMTVDAAGFLIPNLQKPE